MKVEEKERRRLGREKNYRGETQSLLASSNLNHAVHSHPLEEGPYGQSDTPTNNPQNLMANGVPSPIEPWSPVGPSFQSKTAPESSPPVSNPALKALNEAN